jgi:ABC-type transport system substrate-binding protein
MRGLVGGFLILVLASIPVLPGWAQARQYQYVEHLGFNVRVTPLDSIPLRQAIAAAIDRQAAFNATQGKFLRGQGPIAVAGSWFPPFLPQHTPGLLIHPFDLANARSLLDAAGFPDGRGLPEFELLYRSDLPWRQAVAEVLMSQLAAIGLRVKITGLPTRAAFFNRVIPGPGRQPQFQMAIFAWGSNDLKDDFLDMNFLQGAPQNAYGYRNTDVTLLIADIKRESDETKRLAMLREAERIVLTEAPVVPLFYWFSPP